jgi:hypothetical protein
MSTHQSDGDPDPRRRPGPGVPPPGVPPGETPPGEDSTAGAGPRETYNPAKGWAKGPLILILLCVAVFAALFLAMAVVVAL